MPSPSILLPSDLQSSTVGESVTVGGRVIAFTARSLVLADALSSVQVDLESDVPAGSGDLLVVTGRWSGAEIHGARVVEQTVSTLNHGGEFARLHGSSVGRHLALRARALAAVRRYFTERRFIEVDTPVRVRCPGLDAYVDAIQAEQGFLITSPEHHMKRLLIGGMPRIYQLARCSRADEQGPWHEPEFLLLEWYRAFSSAAEIQQDTEALVRAVVMELTGGDVIDTPAGRVAVRPPFERLTVRDAFRRFAKVEDAVELARTDEASYFQTLVDAVEPALAQLAYPVFLTEYPATQAALAQRCRHDPTVAERFELFVGGVELCNGYGELTDAQEQRCRFQAELMRRQRAGARLHPIDEPFLAALAEGMPPSGGNALGLDRLIALALGAECIQDVLAFPWHRP